MALLNLYCGWLAILLCAVAGAIQGMFFYREDWLGGYNSWRRRMTRLGHISFFGIGFINMAYSFSLSHLQITCPNELVSWLLLVCLFSMPLVCYLSAFRMPFRHLFFIPVLSLMIGLGIFIYEVMIL